MEQITLSYLEDHIWECLRSEREPRILFAGKSPLLQGAFLRVAAISHPYFGRAKLLINEDCAGDFKGPFARLSKARTLGLVDFGVYSENESVTLFLSDGMEDVTNVPSARSYTLCAGEEGSVDEDYRYIHAFLSLYGKPLCDFRLPKTPSMEPLSRDWHYLGPSRDMAAYDSAADELLLGLIKNEGALCPEQDHETILAAIDGKPVAGEKLYEALSHCYQTPCLLRDMAAYQHETWMLRTYCFHANPSSKADLLVPYPLLLQRALSKMEGLTLEDRFPIDPLYSDFLVPLYYLRKLLRRVQR